MVDSNGTKLNSNDRVCVLGMNGNYFGRVSGFHEPEFIYVKLDSGNKEDMSYHQKRIVKCID